MVFTDVIMDFVTNVDGNLMSAIFSGSIAIISAGILIWLLMKAMREADGHEIW